MNKKVEKAIGKALAASLVTGVAASVAPSVSAAEVDFNQLYKTAYNAVTKAKAEGTQAAINEARTAINALKGTKAEFAVGEFSKQVDTVQGPKLVKIVKAIMAAQASGKQADINAAKALIEPELPATWRNSYSQAADLIQKALVDKTEAAVKKAQDTKLQADIDAAKALVAEVKTATATLIADWAAGQEAKVNAIVVDFKVESVTNTNLKEILVTFNKEVDKTTAEDESKYTLTATNATIGTAVLQGDKKSVLITLAHEAAQQETVTLNVNGVKDTDGKALDSVDKTLTLLDFTLPVAESISLTGPQEFKITFSEPVNPAVVGSVLVENGIYGSIANASGNVVTVSLQTALAEGSYKVKVAGYKDYAGYEALAKEFTLAYVKDATNVVASVKEASQTSVVVAFNKAVKGTLTTANFYHTFTAWQPSSITDVNGNALVAGSYYSEVKLNFPSNGFPIPAGTTKLAVLASKGNANEVIDQWGNKMSEDANLAVTVASDTTAPTVTKVEATAENKIEVTFSEDVISGDARTVANYTIKGSDGKVVTQTITGIAYSSSDHKATITLNGNLAGGTYSVEIKDVKDTSLLANKIVTTTVAFGVSDKTPATVSSAVVVETLADANAEYVYITFSEAMATTGEGSILDLNNYQLDGAAMPSGSKVELFGSNKKVKLTVPAQALTLVTNNRITIGKLADVTGNKIVAFSTPVTVAADVAPTATSVKSIALNKVEIVVNGILSAVPADGIKVDADGVGGASALAMASYTVDEANNKTIITGTLVSTDVLANPAAKVASIEIVTNKVKSQTGKFMVANANAVAAANITDGIAPSFLAIADSATVNKFAVTFDEALVELNSGLTATEFTVVDKDGKTLVANVDYTATVNGASVDFTLVGSYAGYTGKVTVSTKSSVTYFGDDANGNSAFNPGVDNTAKTFSGKEVTIQ